jgi:uncharacterized protein
VRRRRVPVCVFAKPPLAGLAKTRLAGELGASRAAALARAFFQDTWATVCARPWARPILASTTDDVASFGLLRRPEVWLQGEGDLGARMEHVLRQALGQAPRALLIGADLPGLPPDHLDAALATLDQAEVVLGPSADGGFYLLGATRLRPGALSGLIWSVASTHARTRERLVATGHSVGAAPAWFDVDEPGDLPRLRAMLAETPSLAPRTRFALPGPL